jgi:hypothetical protein
MHRAMSQQPKSRQPRGSARVIEASSSMQQAPAQIYERPDGYYWGTVDGHREFGPFQTHELARIDRDRFDEEAPEPGESLSEAEDEIGISQWIDPETGAPAEGASPPHLDDH